MIDVKKLEKLITLMVENDLNLIDLADEKEQVTLKRGGEGGPVQYVQAPAAAAPAPAPAPAPPAAAQAAGGASAAPAAPSGKTIDSPIVGTFYTASSPDADDFVKVGDKVSADTVVCIVEAMKVFNEIKAEQAGTISKVLVSNGDAVEYGQPLFELG
ncbi:MAG: acetyl-CoA carboxylase biotin carboxyl carrier protein [Phycisphaerales bacterium JB063]